MRLRDERLQGSRDRLHARNRAGARLDRSHRLVIEALESRRLFAVGIREFPIPTANSSPFWITPGPGAELYFTAVGANQLGAYNPSNHGFTSIPIPGLSLSSTSHITAGPDGNLYFTSSNVNAIEQFNPTTHVTEAY